MERGEKRGRNGRGKCDRREGKSWKEGKREEEGRGVREKEGEGMERKRGEGRGMEGKGGEGMGTLVAAMATVTNLCRAL